MDIMLENMLRWTLTIYVTHANAKVDVAIRSFQQIYSIPYHHKLSTN